MSSTNTCVLEGSGLLIHISFIILSIFFLFQW